MTSTVCEVHLDRINVHEQALDILRNTKDGDELDSRDLLLLQDVVNSAGKCLTPTGLRYWSRLRERTANGSYQRQPFCGVSGLRRDQVGYVYWRGVLVEHYSHMDDEKMTKDARVLGAICKSIENRSGTVSAREVMKGYDDLRFGEGSGHQRFLAFWRLEHQAIRFQVMPMVASDRVTAEKERESTAARTAAHWSTLTTQSTGDLRTAVICSQEDYDVLVQGLQSDLRWGWQQGWSTYGSTARLAELLQVLDAQVDRSKLPTRGDLEVVVLGQTLADVITESERTLDALQQEMLGERPVERPL
jgi:hypothetical protein